VLAAAEALSRERIDCEVIDLLSIRPWDQRAVLDSVWRTNRAVVVHQAPRTGGFGAEVAATITERAFGEIDGPVLRLGALDVPVPFAPELENHVLPRADRIATEIRRLFA
jgi:pyruvate/2-oxoglutarate/acetoin dehydrogenase E1 component